MRARVASNALRWDRGAPPGGTLRDRGEGVTTGLWAFLFEALVNRSELAMPPAVTVEMERSVSKYKRGAWETALPLVHGLRLSASVCLALYVAFRLELPTPSWSGTTAALVCLPTLGSSLRKGWYRLIGTVVGASAAVILTAILIDDRIGFLIALAAWGGVCAVLSTLLRNFAAYGAALAGYTMAVIANDAFGLLGGPSDQVFLIAVERASEISIGIVCAGLVLGVTDFGGGRRRLSALLVNLCAEIAQGLVSTLKNAGVAEHDTRLQRLELTRRVIALEPVIDEVIGESAGGSTESSLLHQAAEALTRALSSWHMVAAHCRRQQLEPQLAYQSAVALEAGNTGLCAAAAVARKHAKAARESMRRATRALISKSAGTPSQQLLLDQTARPLQALSRVLAASEVLGGDALEASHKLRSSVLYVTDWLPPLVNAARAFVTIGAVEALWVITGCPNGGVALISAALTAIAFAPLADRAYPAAKSFFLGCLLCAAFVAIIKFAVLPRVESFGGFCAVLACYLTPAGALSARKVQSPMLNAIVWIFIPLLTPTNQMQYDATQFYNFAILFIVGAGIAALALVLWPNPTPAFITRRLLALTLRDLRSLARAGVCRCTEEWEQRVYTRLAVLPDGARRLDRACMIATLTAGVELIELERLVARLGIGTCASIRAAIAARRSTLACQELVRLDERLARAQAEEPAPRLVLRARAAVLALGETLSEFGAYFDN